MNRLIPYSSRIGLILVFLTLTGCENLRPGPGTLYDPVAETFEEALVKNGDQAESVTPPEAVQQALLPPIAIDPTQAGTGEPRFDVTVNSAPAREFFMSLVEDTPENIVLHPDVDGEISLTLKNVTVREVLDAVRDVYGYPYEATPYGYRIMARGLQTRIFNVNYLAMRRTGSSTTQVIAGGQVSSAGSTDESDSSSGISGSSLTGSGSSLATTTESDFWVELESTLEAIIGTAEGRRIMTNANAGIVIVRATPEELHQVRLLLDALEGTSVRQVILEAKILEVTLSDGFQTGINWSALASLAENGDVFLDQTGGGSALGTGLTPGSGLGTDKGGLGSLLIPTASSSGSGTSITREGSTSSIARGAISNFGGIFNVAVFTNDFAALIELLQTQGSVKTLSSPRVSTLNNQQAVIKVGSDEYFVTGVSNSQTSGGGATTNNPEVELTPFFSGIALDVTPQISEDGEVILHIHPSVSEVSEKIKAIGVGTISSLPLAFSTIRESDSIVRTQSGQLIVIGGLMKDRVRHATASVPWLSKIPYLGALARHTLDAYEKTELVIVLRATVIDDAGQGLIIREASERFKRLRLDTTNPGHVPAPVSSAP